MEYTIRRAVSTDLERLKEFLIRAELAAEGLSPETIGSFLVLEDDDSNIKGTLGVEIYQHSGLLRSLVVAPGQAQQKIFALLEQGVRFAKETGLESLLLATNKKVTVPFFELMGFREINQEELPQEMENSQHIRHILNVDNSVFLKLSL
ncbi:GNAT family N-acetyltransferase [Bacillus rubiinfantis]|uniref:GNAT family N-acetyltransferase n=1 Tax=Bacillus rubiinfantis TaxID=1499680 RepID=UPI0005A8D7B4|nr:hypothetical protein [Bacillus rubiinfantis]